MLVTSIPPSALYTIEENISLSSDTMSGGLTIQIENVDLGCFKKLESAEILPPKCLKFRNFPNQTQLWPIILNIQRKL